MTNMSYCRFQNTFGDFRDCAEHIHDNLDKSWDEKRARENLVELAIEMLQELGYDVEHPDGLRAEAVLKDQQNAEEDEE
jgi:hypothetical protein